MSVTLVSTGSTTVAVLVRKASEAVLLTQGQTQLSWK